MPTLSARATTGRAACTSSRHAPPPSRVRRPQHARTPTAAPHKAAVAPSAFADVEPLQPGPAPLTTPRPASPDASLIKPDAVLMAEGGVPVYVFGTEHAAADPAVGAAILGCAPAAVVVETALSPAHGAARGAAIKAMGDWPPADAPAPTLAAAAASPDGEAVVEQARGLAAQLAARLPGTPPAPTPPSPDGPPAMDWEAAPPGAAALWDALAGHFAGEQLAYIAALAAGARLVHGDRPKALTLSRLARGCTLAELDAAVADANASNYASIAAGGVDAPDPPPPPAQARTAFRALLLERDACLCATIDAEARASSAEAAARGGGGAPRPVVAVVGAWHVPGLLHLWEGDAWKGMVGGAEAEPPSEEAWAAAEAAKAGGRLSPAAALGVGRALVDALLRFTATADGGVAEVDPAAAAVPGGQEGAAAAAAAAEVWGSTRMLLALLPPDLLAKVASGWRRDLNGPESPLAVLRAARPVNGGVGADAAALEMVRGLHFFLWK